MPDKPRKLPALGFAGFEDSSAAGGTGRRKARYVINPLRAEALASVEGAPGEHGSRADAGARAPQAGVDQSWPNRSPKALAGGSAGPSGETLRARLAMYGALGRASVNSGAANQKEPKRCRPFP